MREPQGPVRGASAGPTSGLCTQDVVSRFGSNIRHAARNQHIPNGMRSYVALFFVSALVSALLTPSVRALAIRMGAVSHPGGRNVNARAIPRFGGIAICVAFLVALGTLYLSEAGAAIVIHAQRRQLLGLVVGGIALCAVGVVDDAKSVRALYKLYAQIGAAIIAFACGFRIDAILLPYFGALYMGVFALPVTLLWIVGITNAINLIDGLDGLAGGVVAFAAITNLVLAHATGALFVEITMIAVLGSVVGFLLFNFNPARIFMGDSGSYFLGFVLGTMSLTGASQKASTAVSLLVPVLALGLPIVDTFLAVVRRVLERRPLFSPDRGHIHHRLLDMGLTHRRAVLTLYGVCVAFTAAAIGVSLGHIWTVGLALLVATVLVIGVVRFVGHFEYSLLLRRQMAGLRGQDTERLRRLVPEVPMLFASARTENDVWRALETVLERGRIATAELAAADGADAAITRWGEDAVLDGNDDTVSARYAIGPDAFARSELRFRWRNGAAEVSPQADVLLQIIVDVIAAALVRVGSTHAPRAADPPRVIPEEQTGSLPAVSTADRV
jgi:UDP-GlcNAc:undecaprenyl-phosphate/decaprenyl-phosphate GlcNAc-1-phosphate transferase